MRNCYYQRLSLQDREEISRGLVTGLSIRDIAESLSRAPSTISREVRKGSATRSTYRAHTAQNRALRNAKTRRESKRKLMANPELREYVHAGLRKKWSPEQIAQILRKMYPLNGTMRISHEAIYSYLYVLPRGELKKELLNCLRRSHKRRRKRSGTKEASPRSIADMLSIEERPAEVADRTVPGHWEGDLLIGRNRQSALGTLVERTTRTTILVPLHSKKAREVRKAFAGKALRLPEEMRLTMTYDQGREMAEHKLFTKETKMKVYFAHPASPWERGTNENTNGLIRQFFPKGTDFNKVTRKEIKNAQDLLNGRPRKVLDWETPYDAFKKLVGVALET
ncbi:IS30 family transposase [bacterium]|nr:IS30 family transposase [bacterium]